ncbi:MAG TPA: DNA methyltransferase [Armatimonadota bacterium]|nr:DNA methyltransferase [Armatimonadota bacterium]
MTNDWQDRCALIHGPYEQTLETVEAMGGADLVAFSPPYCDARTYGMGVSWDDADYARLGDFVFRALKPGGHALVNVDAPVREWRPGFGTERGFHPWRMMLDWAERVGFRVPDRLAFGRDGTPGAYVGRFRNDWEPLLWFQRPGGGGWFEKESIASESTDGAYIGGSGTNRRNDGTVNVRQVSGWAAENGKTQPGTLWAYGKAGAGQTGAPDVEAQGHPARWPYRLASDIVRCFCPPGGLVVDPFVGAGTTAAAALDHGRRFVGGDLGSRQDHEQNRARGLDPVPWVEVTRRVLTERYRQQSLFG